MKIRKFLIPIFVLVWLTVLVVADIPPPPVNQNLGIYDTMMTNYSEALCRGCHNSETFSLGLGHNSTTKGGVSTRHHNLVVNNTINPFTGQTFQCTDCHPVWTGNAILMERNCMNCHNGTTFWGNSVGANVGSFTEPHHNTTPAQKRNCKFCHGALVDDYNDNHLIPSDPENETTPSSLYKVFNSTSGRLWGGCWSCHTEDITKSPAIYFTQTFPSEVGGKFSSGPIATGMNNVHHKEIIGIDNPPNVTLIDQCQWCHPNLLNVLDIRGCETCHSVRAIHNTQVDFTNTSTLIGYGHIGSNIPSDVQNNSWDCNGCHSWGDGIFFNGTNQFLGAIIPDIQSTTPMVINANTSTSILLNGTNFVQLNGTTNDITVVNVDDTTDLTPDAISNSQINVSVNLTTVGNHYIKVVKTDPSENVPKPSGIRPLIVVSNPIIDKAKLKNDATLTITGTGFGTMPPNARQYVTIQDAGGNIFYSDDVSSWNDTVIIANSSIAVKNSDYVILITATPGSGEALIRIS